MPLCSCCAVSPELHCDFYLNLTRRVNNSVFFPGAEWESAVYFASMLHITTVVPNLLSQSPSSRQKSISFRRTVHNRAFMTWKSEARSEQMFQSDQLQSGCSHWLSVRVWPLLPRCWRGLFGLPGEGKEWHPPATDSFLHIPKCFSLSVQMLPSDNYTITKTPWKAILICLWACYPDGLNQAFTSSWMWCFPLQKTVLFGLYFHVVLDNSASHFFWYWFCTVCLPC